VGLTGQDTQGSGSVPIQPHEIGVTAKVGVAAKEEKDESGVAMKRAFAVGVIAELSIAMLVLHSEIKDFVWTHPWWHSFLVLVTTIAAPILAILELGHSKEANRLRTEANEFRDEANLIGTEQKNSVVKIAEQQEELTRLQAALNKLQAERNEALGQIAIGVKKDLTPAEKNAAKLRKYIGERAAVINSDGSQWDAMGAVIAEVNDDNILQLFIPAGYSSSRATGTCVQCDKLHILEVAKGACKVQITILERYGPTIDYGEGRSWEERNGTLAAPRPRGNAIFHGNYRKVGIAGDRGIYIYAPTNNNPDYSLVTFDKHNQREMDVFYCGKGQVERKFAILQLEWAEDGWLHNGGSGPGNLFLFTR